jgi:hypothetical protein
MSILQAALDVVSNLPGFAAGGTPPYDSPARVTLREAPKWVGLQDRFPQVVVAPREDLCERVIDRPSYQKAWLGYDVYVGLLVDVRPGALGMLAYQLARREEVRLALWKPKALNPGIPNLPHPAAPVGVQWDVLYEPCPKMPEGELPANVTGSWQLFTFVTHQDGWA